MKKLVLLMAVVFAGKFALAEGVTATEIKVGMSNALSGNASALGEGMKTGASAYFEVVNKAGGINGRKINLVSLDDGYEPNKAAENTQKLIDESKVFTLFGYVGTPTSTAVMPIVGKAGIPYVAPFTGAEFLRAPLNPNVFNVRASYFDETEVMIDYLVGQKKYKKIAVFIQDDAYGAAGESGVLRALKKRDMNIAGKGIYKRNTVEVDEGLNTLKTVQPDAVIMVGTYKACAAFVKKAKAAGMKSEFLNLSFVGTAAFVGEVGADGEDVRITQVVPNPQDASVPVVKEYQAAMTAMGKTNFDYTSLEGFVSAKVLVEAFKKAGEKLTLDSFKAALNSLKVDVGGLPIEFSATNHAGSKKVFMTVIKGGKVESVK